MYYVAKMPFRHIAMLVYSMERLLACQELSASLVMNGVFGRCHVGTVIQQTTAHQGRAACCRARGSRETGLGRASHRWLGGKIGLVAILSP